MNRTKIEWTQWTWNPITGCKHGCWYCYAKKLTQRFKKIFPNGFEPTFYPKRLKEPWELKKPNKIFVYSIADLFAPWTPTEWGYRVFDSMLGCSVKHTFQLLTKNPERIIPFLDGYVHKWRTLPENFWIGTTVSTQDECWRIDELRKVQTKVRFVSFEPLLGPIDYDLKGIDWVIVGKLTGSRKVKLDMGWVMDISAECNRLKIPIFLKNNLGLKNPVQEFPRALEGVKSE